MIIKLLTHLIILSSLVACRTSDGDADLKTPDQIASDFKGPDCKNFKPALPTDKYLKMAQKAKIYPVINNTESWMIRWRMIESAKKQIDIQYYILKKDPYSLAMIGLLRQKLKKDKIKLRIMIDSRGSPHLSRFIVGKDYMQELVKLGAEVRIFNPLVNSFGKLNFIRKRLRKAFQADSFGTAAQQAASSFITAEATGNHDKILVVDDRYALFGGRNIATKYFLETKHFVMATDDADIFIDSPALAERAKRAFTFEFSSPINAKMKVDFYDFASRADELDRAYDQMNQVMRPKSLKLLIGGQKKKKVYKTPEGVSKFDPTGVPQTLDGFWRGHYNKPKLATILDNTSILQDMRCHSVTYIARKPQNIQITTSLHYLMQNAKKDIWLMNQYFVPTPEFEQALDAAKENNVNVHLITNNVVSDDVLFTQMLFQNEWPTYAKRYPNLKIHVTTKPAKLHTKMFVIDDEHTIVSSYNIDPLSQNINSELAGYIKDKETAADILKYMKNFIEKNTIEFRIENGKAIGSEQLYDKFPDSKATIERYKMLYPSLKHFRARF